MRYGGKAPADERTFLWPVPIQMTSYSTLDTTIHVRKLYTNIWVAHVYV